MFAIIRARPTHAARLDRWLGAEQTERISAAMRTWHGPPILVGNIPTKGGPIYAHRGGDFSGAINGGFFASFVDRWERAFRRVAHEQSTRMNVGFSSVSDLISKATASAKARPPLIFNKVGSTGSIGLSNCMWRATGQPGAGAASAAAPGGTVCVKTTAGAMNFANASGGDTLHFVAGFPLANVLGNTLLLIDRLHGTAKTMNSTATEAVSGVPTRYQGIVAGAVDSAEGNFLFVDTVTALANTPHNWTVCKYTNQAGTTGQTAPSATGFALNLVNRIDHSSFFMPLATGDTGIKALEQMQCSALVATGAIDFVLAHPLVWMPCPTANQMLIADGMNDPMQLPRIFDDAALSFLDVTKPSATATTFTGAINMVAG